MNDIYTDCEKIEINPNDYLMLVSLNKSFDYEKAHGTYKRIDIYEKSRKYWVVAKERAEKIDYILGVYRGIVRSVIKVDGYEYTDKDEEANVIFQRKRCCFRGTLVNDSPYLNKSVSDYPFGSGGAVRYIANDNID